MAIMGATSDTYTTPALTASDAGAVYSVVVSNAVGSVTSSGAMLTVTAAPTGAGRYLVGQAGASTLAAFVYANGSQSIDSQAILAAAATAPSSASTVEAAGQATRLFGPIVAGNAMGGQVTGLHTRYALYFKGNRLYQIDHEPAMGAPQGMLLSTLMPSDVCASGSEPQVSDQSASDLVDASRSWVFLAAPVSGACATSSDSYRAVRMSMTGSDSALTIGEPVAAIRDGNGAITGYVVRNGADFQRVDANLANPNTLFTMQPSAFKSYGVSFGTAAPGLWLFLNGGQLYAYDLMMSMGMPTVVATLQAGEQIGSILSDGASAYVSITTTGFMTPAFRIVRVTDMLSATTIYSASVLLTQFALTPSRLILVTASSSMPTQSSTVTSVLRDGSGAVDIGGAGSGYLTAFAFTSGENVYLYELGLAGGNGVRTRILASDGSNPQTLSNTAVVGVTLPSSVSAGQGLRGGIYALLLIDGAGANGQASGGTLRSVQGDTRAPLLTYGMLPALPDAAFFPAAIDPLQYGMQGIYTLLPTASATGPSDLYFFDTGMANSLTRVTTFVMSAGTRVVPAVVRAPSRPAAALRTPQVIRQQLQKQGVVR
jgi:hypothetical protein